MGKYDGLRSLFRMSEVKILFVPCMHLNLGLVTINPSLATLTGQILKFDFSHFDLGYVSHISRTEFLPGTACVGLDFLEERRWAGVLSFIINDFHSSNWDSSKTF